MASLGQLLTPAAKDARAEAVDHVQFGNFVRAVEIEIVVRAWSRWPCCRYSKDLKDKINWGHRSRAINITVKYAFYDCS